MKAVKNFLKRKVYLKLLSFLSIPIFIVLVVLILLVSITGAILIDEDSTNNKDYISALEKRKMQIEKNTDVEMELAVYFALDNLSRGKVYSKDSNIHINQDDVTCFIKNKKEISKKDKAVAYKCLDYDKKQIKSFEYFYNLFKKYSEYNNDLSSESSEMFSYPVDKPYVITAGFNSNDEVHNGVHKGIDFVPLNNENIKSISSGTVIETETTCEPFGGYLGNMCGGGFGNHIVIATKQKSINYRIVYGHMSKVNIKENDKVKKKQTIGVVGNSGNTTGKHLHLQIEKQNESGKYIAIDPSDLLSNSEISDDKIELMKRAGVKEKDYEDVDYIISHESSWNYKAVNASSGAYGLCQALPGEKMIISGTDWKSNPITQMKWCNGYAKTRYGSWKKASDFWKKNEWW